MVPDATPNLPPSILRPYLRFKLLQALITFVMNDLEFAAGELVPVTDEMVHPPIDEEERLRAQLNDEDMTPQEACRLVLQHCPRYDETSTKVQKMAKIGVGASIASRT